MSITHSVFLIRDRLPTTAQLNEALTKRGIALQLDASCDSRTHSGFWPAKFGDKNTGFEWLVEPVEEAELDDTAREQASEYELKVSLVARSGPHQLESAVAAWGILTWLSGGLGFAEESGDFFDGATALSIAEEQ